MYTAAIIGYGYWGPILLKNFNGNSRFRIKYVCDRNANNLERSKNSASQHIATNDLEQLFQDPDVDIIIIATQAASHRDLILKSLQANKHVFVEKPFTLSSEDAELICREAKDRNKLVWVDHTFLFTPGYKKLKESINTGKIGSPLRLHSTRTAFGLFQQDTNIIWHLLYHDAYLLLDLFQAMPTEVQIIASATVIPNIEDSVVASFTFANGLHATVHCDMLFAEKKREITVYGKEGILIWDEMRNEKLTYYQNKATYNSNTKKINYLFDDKPEFIPIEDGEALPREIELFAECLDNKSTSPCDCNIALKTVHLLELLEAKLIREKSHD